MRRDFTQREWDSQVEDDCRQIVRLAVREDIGRLYDWTTALLVPADVRGAANVVARRDGVIAGLRAAETALDEMQADVQWRPFVQDGAVVSPGQAVAHVAGSARDILTCERILLNLVGRMSGIATLTQRYVQLVAGTGARLYDTRKTTPGWRRLEKYAVRCGGGHNHRTGLFDAVLIKDNHLAVGQPASAPRRYAPADAVRRARAFLAENKILAEDKLPLLVEIEVDTLEQLAEVLPAQPDIVLLDNMSPAQLAAGVRQRNEVAPQVELEASGGITFETIRAIAESGVERISCGALTHSAVNFDVGLDWQDG